MAKPRSADIECQGSSSDSEDESSQTTPIVTEQSTNDDDIIMGLQSPTPSPVPLEQQMDIEMRNPLQNIPDDGDDEDSNDSNDGDDEDSNDSNDEDEDSNDVDNSKFFKKPLQRSKVRLTNKTAALDIMRKDFYTNRDNNKSLDNSINAKNLGLFVKMKLKNTYKYIPDEKRKKAYIVYFFNENTGYWQIDEENVETKRKIKALLTDDFVTWMLEFQNNSKAEHAAEFRVWISKKLTTSAVLKEIISDLHDPFFIHHLDSKKHLIAFKNGILDLNGSRFEFRKAVASDYVSSRFTFPYRCRDPSLPRNAQIYQHLITLLSQIFPDEDERKFYFNQKAWSIDMRQHGNLQTTIALIGSGANGKSVIANLDNVTFAKRHGRLTSTQLTKSIDTTKPNTEIQAIADTMIVSMDEKGLREVWKADTFKHLVNGTLPCRGNYEIAKHLVAYYQMFLYFNNEPNVLDTSYGSSRRMIIMFMRSSFTDDDLKVNGITVFKKNPNFETPEGLTEFRGIYMGFLISMYFALRQKMESEKISITAIMHDMIPNDVELATDKFAQSTKPHHEIILQNFKFGIDEKCSLKDMTNLVNHLLKKGKYAELTKENIGDYVIETFKVSKEQQLKVNGINSTGFRGIGVNGTGDSLLKLRRMRDSPLE